MEHQTENADNAHVARHDHPSYQQPAAVLVECDDCGDFELTAADIVVRVCLDDDQSSYVFRCPDCGVADARPVNGDSLARLLNAGSPMQTWSLPRELAEHDNDAAPITFADVAAFVAALDAEPHTL